MPAQIVPGSRAVVLEFYLGTNPNTGNPIYRNVTFGGLRPDATAQSLYDFGVAIANLQAHQLNGLAVVDRAQLINV